LNEIDFFSFLFLHSLQMADSKLQWFYAFNIVPMTDAPMSVLLAEPADTTEFPFVSILTGGVKRPLDNGAGGFFRGDEGRDPKRQGKDDLPSDGCR
jgi:hypothetical protein